MFKRKNESAEYDPMVIFMNSLKDEFKKESKLFIKVERLPQGSMENYMFDYVPAVEMCNHRNFHGIVGFVAGNYDGGDFLLTLVDSKRRPLQNVRAIRILTGPIRNDDMKSKLDITFKDLILQMWENDENNKKAGQKMLLDICINAAKSLAKNK